MQQNELCMISMALTYSITYSSTFRISLQRSAFDQRRVQ